MFFDFGPGEIIGLAVLAMILIENLGPGFEDLEPSDLNPKSFIKKQIANVMDQDDADSEIKVRAKIDPDLL
jgi:sec-independent protein translocase protein TatB